MAVGSGTPYNIHIGNGVTTTFAYGFTLLNAADLVVTIDGVATSSYTVTGLGVAAGGTVVFGTAPANGAKVILLRVIQLVRATDYQDDGDLLADTLNADFNRLWMAIQGVSAFDVRGLRAPFPEVLNDLPAAADRADKILTFDSAGQPILALPVAGTAGALAADLASSASATKGAGMLGYSVLRAYAQGTVGAKLNGWVSVKDFGAKGDGVHDDTQAFRDALDSGFAEIYVPPSSAFYRITDTLAQNAVLYGLGGPFRSSTIIKMDSNIAKPMFRGVGAELQLKDVRGLALQSVQSRMHTAFDGGAYQVTLQDLLILDMNRGLDVEGVYLRIKNCYVANCNIGMYPRYLSAAVELPSTMFRVEDTVFTDCTYGFLNENRFGAGQDEDLINIEFDNCGFERCTNGWVATQRTWLTTMKNCWFEGNTSKSFDGAASDVIWINNRVDPGDPAPIFCPADDTSLGSVQLQPRASRFLTANIRTLAPNIVSGETNAVVMDGSFTFSPQFLPNGNAIEAGKELTQVFSDNTGTAKAGVRFARFNALSGAGVRSSAEIRIAAQGSSDPSDGMPYQDVLVVRGTSVLPAVDNGQSLGAPGARWSVVYAATGAINTSDERSKEDIGGIPDEWLDAWADVEWQRFKFKDAATEKGSGARWHVGVIAQRVKTAFEARGLDPFQLGLLCRDEWPEQPAAIDIDGTVTSPAQPAGNIMGIRYEEALAMEAALMRRELQRLKAQH